MADQREISWRLGFAVDSSGIDRANQAQEELRDTTEQTKSTVNGMGTQLNQLGSSAAKGLGEAAQAGKNMGTAVAGAARSSSTAAQNLGKAIRTVAMRPLNEAVKKIQTLGTTIKGTFQQIGTSVRHPIQTIETRLTAALEKAGRSTEKTGEDAEKAGTKLKKMGDDGEGAGTKIADAFKRIVTAISIGAAVKMGVDAIKNFSSAAINAAADAEETQSKFETVFGSQTEKTLGWVDNFSKAAHRSRNEIKGFLADSQAVFTGLGMGEEAAADMSRSMTSLSYDLASFHNISDEDAFAKMRSGLLGEAEGLKSLGVILNEATLKQSMESMGLKGKFENLDEITKVQVRYNSILAQTTTAQTDVTRTSDSYTNSLKGVQGIWQEFLANAGARFTPVLTGLFNTIIEAWPTIEPMLMQLVDLLGDGLSDAVPILIELGQQLLPVFTQALGVLFSVLQPVIPVIGDLIQTLLPPLAGTLGNLCGTLLPPLIELLDMLNVGLLQPLMPVITTLANALLPPIAAILQVIMDDILQPLMPVLMQLVNAVMPLLVSLLDAVSPLLNLLSPVLQAIAEVLGWIVDAVAEVCKWVAGGVGDIVNWFSGLFGGADEAAGAVDDLSKSVSSLDVPAPDSSAVTNTFAVDIPAAADAGWTSVQTTSDAALTDIGTTADDTYSSMAASSDAAWSRMVQTSQNSVRQIQQEIGKLTGVDVTMGVQYKSTMDNVPHNASGTDNFAGGWTHINEKGGELAFLPGGTAIVPADKTDRILSMNSSTSKNVNVDIHITVDGATSAQDKSEIARIAAEEARRAVRDELDDQDTNSRIQDGYYDLAPA